VSIQSFTGRWSSFTGFFNPTRIRHLQAQNFEVLAHRPIIHRINVRGLAGSFIRRLSKAIPRLRWNSSGSIHWACFARVCCPYVTISLGRCGILRTGQGHAHHAISWF